MKRRVAVFLNLTKLAGVGKFQPSPLIVFSGRTGSKIIIGELSSLKDFI
ncbi:MAG: hypothetical protein J7L26_02515 [Candidatus Aminicenantes bacterium]|nr:hypothetical protein [Candidatus Aminicenantes bacterium]